MPRSMSLQRLTSVYVGKRDSLNNPSGSFTTAFTAETFNFTEMRELENYAGVKGRATMAPTAFAPDLTSRMAELSFSGPLTFPHLLIAFNAGLGKKNTSLFPYRVGASVLTPSNAVNRRIWKWQPPVDASQEIEYLNLSWREEASNADTELFYINKAFCTSIELESSDSGLCTMSSSYIGGRVNETNFTPSTLIPNMITVPVKMSSIGFYDSLSAANSADLTDTDSDVSDFKISIDTGHTPLHTKSDNADLDFTQEIASTRTIMITGNMYGDLNKSIDNHARFDVERDAGYAGDIRFVKMRFESPSIIERVEAVPNPYYLEITVPCYHESDSMMDHGQEDSNGIRLYPFNLMSTSDIGGGDIDYYIEMANAVDSF